MEQKNKFEEEGQLVIDIYQTPEKFVIESPVAGVKADDLDINISRDSVFIKGTRHHHSQINDDDYLYRECYWGPFSRSIILPQEVDAEKASVEFKDGILIIDLPKLIRKDEMKKIKIKTD
ncbi:MAG: Hsp20/alpha crystallin family protein [Patescibacteria group bacterium]|nr:Hsp20/alpha crystallin family protein [Patescibacteria group bacterium]